MNNMNKDEAEEITQKVREVLKSPESGKNLITILLAIQKELGYLPQEGMGEVARHLNISPTTVYSVATFYNRFRFVPPGKHHIRVCMGTACHVKRSNIVLESWKRRLNIEEGGVTPDREFSLERVDCVGCCALAPVVVVGDEVQGKMSPTKVDGILLKYELGGKEKDKKGE